MCNKEKAHRMALASSRSNVYGLLATVYRAEVKADILRQVKDPQLLGVLSDLGLQLTSEFFRRPEEELLDELAVEFTRLFLGPGQHISPHESVHRQRGAGQSGLLWGESTAEVKKFIESTGLSYHPAYKGLPDHISVELEFMQQLTLREEQAWRDEDENAGLHCLKTEKKFIEEHLVPWVPAFCDKVIKEAELSFYREMAALTKSFMEFEKEEVEGYVGAFYSVAYHGQFSLKGPQAIVR
jgi:TorA maturation chaperone TorD